MTMQTGMYYAKSNNWRILILLLADISLMQLVIKVSDILIELKIQTIFGTYGHFQGLSGYFEM